MEHSIEKELQKLFKKKKLKQKVEKEADLDDARQWLIFTLKEKK